jgi:hypothetical protein
MANEQRIYHRNKIGWFVEMPGYLEGPLQTREEAVNFANLLNRVGMARSAEIACTDKECL